MCRGHATCLTLALLSLALAPTLAQELVDMGSGEVEDHPGDTLAPGDHPESDQVPTQNETVSDIVDQFLSMVERYEQNKDNCTPGVTQSLGPGVVAQYGIQRFKAQAMLAVEMANFLTRIWKRSSQNVLDSEYFFYTAVRTLLESDPNLFAFGNCYDKNEYKNYTLFCPYAMRMANNPDQIMVKDLSVEYKYLGNESDFFYMPRTNAEAKLQQPYNLSIGYAMYQFNDTLHHEAVLEESIRVLYEDGYWGDPYFDCKGGDIWMMTYTVPFFGYRNGSYYFKGTSGIDIDLEKVDIDQCPLPTDSTVVNVFAGSHKCKETTKCIPVPGLGFRRGSYKCACEDGYYYPNTTQAENFFTGVDIENEYERKIRGEYSRYDDWFVCLECAPGCGTCTNGNPCILSLDWVLRSVVLGVNSLFMCFIPVLVWFTFKYRDVKVLKAASPMLLRTILLGATLLYAPMIVQYFEPTEITCSLRTWLREIGFSISYGALLLKTWRISVVFRVRSAQRVKISDTDLIKRLVLIVLLFAAYLTVRMVVGRPQVVKGEHSNGLHTYQCSWDVWDYCAAIAELCLLLWGIRLCIVVRKAPSEFNESRFISWAIYNETLLSLFLNITMFFLQSPANPDLLYLVLFIHTQLTTTVTLAFLFGSKAYVVLKLSGREQPQTTISRGSKYVAAPKTASSILYSQNRDTTCMTERLCDDGDCGTQTLEKDIQEEFKRLYMQLETLKQKNMKLGNPHLTYKLSAMTEAAMKEEPQEAASYCADAPPYPNTGPYCPDQPRYTADTRPYSGDTPAYPRDPRAYCTTNPPTYPLDTHAYSPNMNGKRVVINLDTFQEATSL